MNANTYAEAAAALQVMGSEVGVVDIPNWDIASKGRLMPGNIFLVDFDAGRVIKDEEVGNTPSQMFCHPLSNVHATSIRPLSLVMLCV